MSTEPDGREPLDYRMSFAAERTYLAYIRTSLALLAAGVAVVGALPDLGHERVRQVMGVVLVVAGLTMAIAARPRWRRADAAMRLGTALPRSTLDAVVVTAVVVAGLLGLLLIALV